MSHPASNLQGIVFGKLRAVAPTEERSHSKSVIWLCQCLSCGKEVRVSAIKLKEGVKQSCGCLERSREVRTPRGHSGLNSAYNSCSNGAKKRGLPFLLSFVEFKSLVLQACTYCGVENSRSVKGSRGRAEAHGTVKCNGIDRVDSKHGYILANCVPCCATCNLAKHTMTTDQFTCWITRVYTRMNS